ncbi:MAG: YrdB family protein [Bacteroidota bacterium]
MASHLLNLVLRFALELMALVASGAWGWHRGGDITKYVFALTIPILLTAVWGIFAVPDDPSRSGNTVVPTSGIVRLAIELVFFTFAVLCLYDIATPTFAFTYAAVALFHYILSYDRVVWLLWK